MCNLMMVMVVVVTMHLDRERATADREGQQSLLYSSGLLEPARVCNRHCLGSYRSYHRIAEDHNGIAKVGDNGSGLPRHCRGSVTALLRFVLIRPSSIATLARITTALPRFGHGIAEVRGSILDGIAHTITDLEIFSLKSVVAFK